jgi:hypothetical protein
MTPYEKGKKAKSILNVYRNPFIQGSYEHEQFKKGFNESAYEPINFEIELTEESFIDEYEELIIINHGE